MGHKVKVSRNKGGGGGGGGEGGMKPSWMERLINFESM